MPTEQLTKVLPSAQLAVGGQTLTVPEGSRSILLTRNAAGQFMLEETAKLGDSDVFVKRDASGVVRLVYKAVRLYQSKREIAEVAHSWMPTVAGYNRLNQIAGVSPITPPTIFADGVEHSNPFVQYDAEGSIKRVIARKIAIGYSPIGTLVAIDTVRHYNFDAYYLQDLQAKTKKFPDAARYGTRILCPFDREAVIKRVKGTIFAQGKEKIWVFKTVKDIEGIWIDPQHPEIQEVYNQHIRHQMFGETIAQNIAWRNALKAHPAIATSTLTVNNGVAEVMVFGYRHELDRSQLEKVADDIVKGRQVTGVEVKHDEGDATAEEIATEVADVLDETVEETGGAGTIEPAETPEQDQRTLAELMDSIAALAKAKGVDVNAISKMLFKEKYGSIVPDQMRKLEKYLESAAPAGEATKQ